MTHLQLGTHACTCAPPTSSPKRIALTGGPGAGKTAVLEMATRLFCRHVVILPESAGVLFGGGFPRDRAAPALRAAQRAIFYVQRELERMQEDACTAHIVLCDRGTIDGLAYWPGDPSDFWQDVKTTHKRELARYDAVVHLSTPTAEQGYNQQNHLRIESAEEALAIDRRIAALWKDHPRYLRIDSQADFFEKAHRALNAMAVNMPSSCVGFSPVNNLR